MANLLRIKRLEEISLVDKGASGNADINPAITIVKRRSGPMNKNWLQKAMAAMFAKQEGGMSLEEAMAGLSDDAKAVIMEALKMAAMKQDESNPDPDPEKNLEEEEAAKKAAEEAMAKLKDLPEPIKKALADAEANKKEIAELSKRLARQDEEAEIKKYMGDAAELRYLVGKSDPVIAKALRTIHKNLDKEDAEIIMGVLKNANAAMRVSKVFDVPGVVGVSSHAGSAWAEAKQLAKTIVEKNADITEADAITKVFERNPELYSRYREEKAESRAN